jgi:ribosomal-protein-alanine N-acetyltransferase
VAEKENAPQGFLIAHEIAGEWELENIVVSEQARRRGLATRLLFELMSVARTEHALAIFLEVRESNHAARAFYQSRGFEPTGRRPRYYSDPDEDAITYRLRLA